MENHWIGLRRNRQTFEIIEFLEKTFNDIAVIDRPHPNGVKLFVKQLSLHIGNVIRERNTWHIYHYDTSGGYSQKSLPEFNTAEFWTMIRESFSSSIMRGALLK